MAPRAGIGPPPGSSKMVKLIRLSPAKGIAGLLGCRKEAVQKRLIFFFPFSQKKTWNFSPPKCTFSNRALFGKIWNVEMGEAACPKGVRKKSDTKTLCTKRSPQRVLNQSREYQGQRESSMKKSEGFFSGQTKTPRLKKLRGLGL